MHTQILIAFFAYFVILLTIGLLAHKKQNSAADFIMGNRTLNFWLTALSAHASDMSAWLFMGFPAAIFIGGLSQSWIAIGLLIGMFCNWHFVAKKLRTGTEQSNSYTLSTFFERRYQDNTNIIRILTATISIFFLICYLAAGLIAMGLLLESIFDVDYYFGLCLATLVVVIYTFYGGFVTVAWTDLFQALFLLLVIFVVALAAYFQLPEGFTSIVTMAEKKNISFTLLSDYSYEGFFTALFLASWGLGYFGQPHVITKFMGIRNASDMYKSKYLGMTWQFIALAAAAAIGLIGIAFFAEGLANSQLVFIEIVKTVFPPLAAGFILCAVLAANMSTMDSQILVCASVLSEDFYKPILHKNASQKELLWVSRLGVVASAVVALVLALNKSTTVLEAVQYAWSGLGCAFGPLVLMSLYSVTTNKYGAIAGIVVGGVIAALWSMINPYLTEYVIPAMIPAFLLSLLSIWLVSKATSGGVSVQKT